MIDINKFVEQHTDWKELDFASQEDDELQFYSETQIKEDEE